MEHIGRVASHALAQSNGSTPQQHTSRGTMDECQERAAIVWRSMVELFGPSFLTAYGDSPSPLWKAAISELSDDECRVGFTTLAKQAREYPANLTQFVGACRPEKLVRYLGSPTSAAEMRALEPPKPSPSVAEKWLAEIRRNLGVKHREPGEDG